jgi:hypothetical protein
MAARSHKDQFINALRTFPHEKASFSQLAGKLGDKWTPEKVEAKAREFDDDATTRINIVKHGVQYFGSETGPKPGLYKEVRRGIERCWGADNAMRNISIVHCSRTAERNRGPWSQPDLIGQVRRRADAKPEVVYLAIEVERAEGFDVRSIYQAYEFGRGADFSWVFYEGPVCDGTKWEQIKVAASDLGVGVVHAARPTEPSKWKTQVPARIRPRTAAQQRDFLQRSGVTPEMFDADQ